MAALISYCWQSCFGATENQPIKQPLGSKNYTSVIITTQPKANPTQDMRAAHTHQQILNEKNAATLPVLQTNELEATCLEYSSFEAYDWWSWLCPAKLLDVEQLHQTHIAQPLAQSKTIAEFINRIKQVATIQLHQPEDLAEEYSELLTRGVELSQQFMQRMDSHPACKDFSAKDKYRALTNYWAYALFAHCCGEKIETIPEDIFAVSLLYPLTDDLMDNLKDKDIKRKICEIISDALKPETDLTQLKASIDLADHELKSKLQHIIDLINTVKKAHQAEENCSAFASLRVIHQLQIQSSQIQTTAIDLRDIFAITARKGAGSVMIDAYLQKHQLTEQQQELAVLMGTLAQLLNDIEGIEEDIKAKITTPATRYFGVDRNIDSLVRGVLFIVERAKQQLPDNHERSGIHRQKTLIALQLFTVKLLASALQGAGTSKCKLSPDFVKFFENYSQLPAPFMAALKTLEIQLYQQGTLKPEQQMKNLRQVVNQTRETLNPKPKRA